MTELGTLSVKLTATTAEFARKMNGVQEKMRGVAETAKKVSKIAAVAFAGMAASLAVVARAYDKQIRAERGLEAAFRAQGKAIDTTRLKELASALQRVTLFGDEVTLENMKMMATFGVTENAIASLIPQIQDLAAGQGIDLKTATLAVAKTMGGMPGALGRYVGALSKAQQEIIQTGTESEKLAVLTQKLSGFQGQAALAASTAAGSFFKLSNNFGDVLENIGEIVDAPLASVLNTISTAVVKVGAFIKNLSPEFKTWAGRIALVATVLTAAVAGATALIAISPAIIGAVGALAAAFGVLSATLWPIILGIAAIAVVIAGAILGFGMLKKAWDANLFGMRDTLTWWVNATKTAWVWWANKVVIAWDAWAFGAKKILGKVSGWIETAVNNWVKGLGILGEALGIKTLAGLKDIKIEFSGESLKQSILTIGDFWSDKIKKGADFVADAWATGTEETKKLLQPLIDGLKELVDIKLPEMPTAPGLPGLAPGAPPGGDTAEDVNEAMKTTAERAQAAAEGLAQAAGPIGRVVQAFVKGGAIAGIIALVVEALSTVKVFGRILSTISQVFMFLGRAFEPVLKAIEPLFMVAVKLVGVFLQLFIKLNPIIILLVALAPVFNMLAIVIDKILMTLVGVFNWIVSSIANMVRKIPGIGDELASFVKSFAIDIELPPGPRPSEDAEESLGGLGGAANDAAESMRELSESMGNVPSGFKVAFARFEASDPLNVGLGGGATLPGSGGGGILVENMNVFADNASDLAREIQEEREWQGYAGTGSPGADEETRYSGKDIVR